MSKIILTNKEKEMACKAIMNNEAVMVNINIRVADDFSIENLQKINNKPLTLFNNALLK